MRKLSPLFWALALQTQLPTVHASQEDFCSSLSPDFFAEHKKERQEIRSACTEKKMQHSPGGPARGAPQIKRAGIGEASSSLIEKGIFSARSSFIAYEKACELRTQARAPQQSAQSAVAGSSANDAKKSFFSFLSGGKSAKSAESLFNACMAAATKSNAKAREAIEAFKTVSTQLAQSAAADSANAAQYAACQSSIDSYVNSVLNPTSEQLSQVEGFCKEQAGAMEQMASSMQAGASTFDQMQAQGETSSDEPEILSAEEEMNIDPTTTEDPKPAGMAPAELRSPATADTPETGPKDSYEKLLSDEVALKAQIESESNPVPPASNNETFTAPTFQANESSDTNSLPLSAAAEPTLPDSDSLEKTQNVQTSSMAEKTFSPDIIFDLERAQLIDSASRTFENNSLEIPQELSVNTDLSYEVVASEYASQTGVENALSEDNSDPRGTSLGTGEEAHKVSSARGSSRSASIVSTAFSASDKDLLTAEQFHTQTASSLDRAMNGGSPDNPHVSQAMKDLGVEKVDPSNRSLIESKVAANLARDNETLLQNAKYIEATGGKLASAGYLAEKSAAMGVTAFQDQKVASLEKKTSLQGLGNQVAFLRGSTQISGVLNLGEKVGTSITSFESGQKIAAAGASSVTLNNSAEALGYLSVTSQGGNLSEAVTQTWSKLSTEAKQDVVIQAATGTVAGAGSSASALAASSSSQATLTKGSEIAAQALGGSAQTGAKISQGIISSAKVASKSLGVAGLALEMHNTSQKLGEAAYESTLTYDAINDEMQSERRAQLASQGIFGEAQEAALKQMQSQQTLTQKYITQNAGVQTAVRTVKEMPSEAVNMFNQKTDALKSAGSSIGDMMSAKLYGTPESNQAKWSQERTQTQNFVSEQMAGASAQEQEYASKWFTNMMVLNNVGSDPKAMQTYYNQVMASGQFQQSYQNFQRRTATTGP